MRNPLKLDIKSKLAKALFVLAALFVAYEAVSNGPQFIVDLKSGFQSSTEAGLAAELAFSMPLLVREASRTTHSAMTDVLETDEFHARLPTVRDEMAYARTVLIRTVENLIKGESFHAAQAIEDRLKTVSIISQDYLHLIKSIEENAIVPGHIDQKIHVLDLRELTASYRKALSDLGTVIEEQAGH